MTSPSHCWRVDAVLGEEGEHVAFLPVEMRAKTGAEFLCCLLQTSVGVVASCGRTLVDNLGVGKRPVLALEEDCPEVGVGNIDARNLARHSLLTMGMGMGIESKYHETED